MSNVNFVLLYVENVARSADFYSRLLEKPVPESSPGFAMLPVAPGLMLGLWRRDGVEPKAGAPGGGEIAIDAARRRRGRGGARALGGAWRRTSPRSRRAWISATLSWALIPTAIGSAHLRHPPPEARWTDKAFALYSPPPRFSRLGAVHLQNGAIDCRPLQRTGGGLHRRHSRQRLQSQYRDVLPVAGPGTDHFQPRQAPAVYDHAGVGRRRSSGRSFVCSWRCCRAIRSAAARASTFRARRNPPISPTAARAATRRRICSFAWRSFRIFSTGKRFACASRFSSASPASSQPRCCSPSTRDERDRNIRADRGRPCRRKRPRIIATSSARSPSRSG